jgi:hypothetical protein
MLKALSNLTKTAGAFLQTGVAPPNTPPELKEQMQNTNHLSSKKFFLTFSGFIILGVFYVVSTALLYTMSKTPEMLTAYTVLFTKTMEVFATIMAVYLGGQAVVDLRYNSSSSASLSANIQEVDVTNKIVGNEKEDDYHLE